MTTKKTPQLLVVFDTNVLFTQVASELVRKDVKKIIHENSNHPDLNISWYLPEIVVDERKYQMLKNANQLLPSMLQLEKLLGHKFGLGSDTLELHVDKAIKVAKTACGFKTISIDTTSVDWEDMITRSVCREPPFEAGEKEKGFRDAIIANSFLQLHRKSPITPTICRLALVSGDGKLKEYISEQTAESKNVRVLTTLDELEALINTLVSRVTEEFVAELTSKADSLFFEKDNDRSIYYKENVGELIRKEYQKILRDNILPGHIRDSGQWWISQPIFIKKERQQIYWMTPIKIEFEIIRYETPDSPQTGLMGPMPSAATTALSQSYGIAALGQNYGIIPSSQKDILTTSNKDFLPPVQSPFDTDQISFNLPPRKIVALKGREKFEVHWSTNLTQAHNLTKPNVDSIEYLGNDLPT